MGHEMITFLLLHHENGNLFIFMLVKAYLSRILRCLAYAITSGKPSDDKAAWDSLHEAITGHQQW